MSSAISGVLRRHFHNALANGRLEEAANLLDRLKAEAPLDKNTRGLELELLIKSRRYEESEALAEQLRHTFPDSGRILFLSGQSAYRVKSYKRAEAYFRESIRLFSHWKSRYWLGKTLTQSGVLDEARSLLEEAVVRFPPANRDLAWLFERKGDLERALACYEKLGPYQLISEHDKRQITRIKAKMLDPVELVDELETLSDLGEDIPLHLFKEYVEKLFQTGRGGKAREEIQARMEEMNAKIGTDVAWSCYHAKAYDLAFELFTRYFKENCMKPSFLNSLQFAARKCKRIEALLPIYEAYAPKNRNLYGRMKKLEREVEDSSPDS